MFSHRTGLPSMLRQNNSSFQHNSQEPGCGWYPHIQWTESLWYTCVLRGCWSLPRWHAPLGIPPVGSPRQTDSRDGSRFLPGSSKCLAFTAGTLRDVAGETTLWAGYRVRISFITQVRKQRMTLKRKRWSSKQSDSANIFCPACAKLATRTWEHKGSMLLASWILCNSVNFPRVTRSQESNFNAWETPGHMENGGRVGNTKANHVSKEEGGKEKTSKSWQHNTSNMPSAQG